MRTMTMSLIPGLLALVACGSPPKPPTVDGSGRHPVNSGVAVELQVCKNELHNTRILATESGRVTESTSASLAHLIAQQRALSALRENSQLQTEGNSIYTVRFEFGSWGVDMPPGAAQRLIEQAKTAPLIMLRGRTDGASDSAAESHVARERASAVRDYLVAAGLDPARIRVTYQPAGDQVADNSSSTGRSLNRRVEIEIYRALPVSLDSGSALP